MMFFFPASSPNRGFVISTAGYVNRESRIKVKVLCPCLLPLPFFNGSCVSGREDTENGNSDESMTFGVFFISSAGCTASSLLLRH